MGYLKQKLRRPPSLTPSTSGGRWPHSFSHCTICTGEHVSCSDCYPCCGKGGVGHSCHHPCCISGWASWFSHPFKNNCQCKESHRTRIPKMGEGTFIPFGSLCRQYSLAVRETRWHHHNHSTSQQQGAWHLLEEEWWALRGIFSSALSGSSPEPAPQEEEDPGAKPKVLPPGNHKVPDHRQIPQNGCWQSLDQSITRTVVEPTVATMISTTVYQDQTMGAIYLSMVNNSMGLMNLEASSVAVGHQGLTIEELTEEDLAEGSP